MLACESGHGTSERFPVQILITGAGGFVGRHLAQHIAENQRNADIHGTIYSSHETLSVGTAHQIDLKDQNSVDALIQVIQPDVIYHLAGQASVRRSFDFPWETLENNVRSQFNILQACLTMKHAPRVLIISSAEIYGQVAEHELPITEDSPFRPSNPYSVSKVTQDVMGMQYFRSHALPVICARPFNHIGPGQAETFAAADFAMQIARIEASIQDPIIRVGNLRAQRDFTDVRDIVRAYCLLIERGDAGTAYNIASSRVKSIQELLDTLLSFSRVSIAVQQDPDKFRPVDIPVIQGQCERLHSQTGWQPSYSFEDTLHDLLEDCRARVQHSLRS